MHAFAGETRAQVALSGCAMNEESVGSCEHFECSRGALFCQRIAGNNAVSLAAGCSEALVGLGPLVAVARGVPFVA